MVDMNFARTRLEHAINVGRASAGRVVEQVLSRLPDDELTHAAKTTIEVDPDGRALFVTPEHEGSPLTPFAFGQLATRSGMPVGYARELLEQSRPAKGQRAWQADLLAHSLSQHLQHSEDRFLVRRLEGRTHGVLSDAYKRMDSRPLLDAFVATATQLGAVPISGHATDSRIAVRALIPTIYEPVPGEAVAFGLNWQNSDFGAGSYRVSAYLMRLWCLNGAVGDAELKKAHIGARLDFDFEVSRETHRLTERALAGQTKDAVRGLLGPAAIEAKLDVIRNAHSKEVDFETAWRSVGRELSKGDKEQVKQAFESQDDINLPAGKTMWRFSNALSWIANAKDTSEDKRLDLQSLAGKVAGVV